MQTPSVGRIVLVKLSPSDATTTQGEELAPAVIVKVWSDTMINAKVILNSSGEDRWYTSVNYGGDDATPETVGPYNWIWPPHV